MGAILYMKALMARRGDQILQLEMFPNCGCEGFREGIASALVLDSKSRTMYKLRAIHQTSC